MFNAVCTAFLNHVFLLWPEHCPVNAHCGTVFTLSEEKCVHLMGQHCLFIR